MNVYQFTVIIERQPEGEYPVSAPALPGCYTEGRTLEEAREMAADAIRAYCASLNTANQARLSRRRSSSPLTRDKFVELLKQQDLQSVVYSLQRAETGRIAAEEDLDERWALI